MITLKRPLSAHRLTRDREKLATFSCKQRSTAAKTLADRRVPPGNRLEKLRGDRKGQHSIRINDQWRICFPWTKAGPEDATITDCH